MRIKKTLNLLLNNFRIVYKLLIYQLIVLAITLAIGAVIVVKGCSPITESLEFQSVLGMIRDFFSALVTGDSQNILPTFNANFSTALTNLLVRIGTMRASLIFTVILLVVLLFLSSFCMGIGSYTAGSLLNCKMEANARQPFLIALVQNLKESALYQLINVPLSFALNFVSVAICYGVFFLLIVAVGNATVWSILFCVFFAVTLIIVLQAVKQTVLSAWMPSIFNDKKGVVVSFRRSFRMDREQFWNTFSNYLVMIYIIVIVNVLCCITTFGSALLISLPASTVLLLCFRFADFYIRHNRSFFIADEDISRQTKSPKKIGIFTEDDLH